MIDDKNVFFVFQKKFLTFKLQLLREILLTMHILMYIVVQTVKMRFEIDMH